ncbi:MAG: response regulator transcription factor [Clostridiales bacterium]|jgi:two-component system response regulator VicR|nr:response regulator transcription factor [Clostridiales bacterium]
MPAPENKTALIVDDEKRIVDIIAYNLRKEGFTALTATDGEEGLGIALSKKPDIIILDIMMPGLDGFEFVRRLRKKNSAPVIMLTARVEESDVVTGLSLGADDYVTKPFSNKELIARVRANLRRAGDIKPMSKNGEGAIRFGPFEVDASRVIIRKRGDIIDVTHREFELLRFLALSAGTVFSREELLEKVWGYEYFGDVRTVDVTIRRLRQKIEDNPDSPKWVRTRRGVGYYLDTEHEKH